MKKFFVLFVFLLLFVLNGFSQNAKPTTTPPVDDDIVKISTTLIQIDVTVTDSKGKIVKDLKPEDFEIFENGKKQDITNFSFVSNVKTQTDPVTKSKDNVAVPVPQADLKPEQIRRTFALVVDDLTLSFESTYQVRRALKKFVDEQMQDGDLAAIIRTGAGIGALQQFTSDKRRLYAAIEKVIWNSSAGGGLGAFAPIQDSDADSQENEGTDQGIGETRDLSEQADDFRNEVLANATLDSLNHIIKGMQELPGRKSVMLFSDGLPLFTKSELGFLESGRILEAIRRVTDSANRSSVVIYSLDARGLQPTFVTAQDKINSSPGRLQTIISGRSSQLFDLQQGLIVLAEGTGGFAITNNNDLAGGVRKILDDQSYYLIGYQPDSDAFDAKTRRFNKIEVKLKRSDLKARYRNGFFGVTDEKIAKQTNQTPAQQITNALVSPFAVNDISLRLNTLFGNDAGGNFVRSLVHVSAQDLKFTDEADGTKKASFDVLAMSFGDNGVPVDRISQNYTFTVKGNAYQKILNEGFVYFFTFPVKKPGAYQFRVALRDSQAGKVGSASQFIEVPNLKKDRLTLSGIVLENLTREQWEKNSTDPQNIQVKEQTGEVPLSTNPMHDTSLRKFKLDTILRYGFEVYNSKLDGAKKPNLTTQIRIFHDGKLVLNGQKIPLDTLGQTDLDRIQSVGAISLGDGMPTGDYILQIIVFDNQAKEKRKIATQYVQFEIVAK